MLLSYLEESILLGSFGTKLSEDVRESRFSKGKVCPHCKGSDISRNGKYNGKQRYICKSCKKTFNDFTKSPVSYSKKDLSMWIKYAKLMVLLKVMKHLYLNLTKEITLSQNTLKCLEKLIKEEEELQREVFLMSRYVLVAL